MVLAGALAAYAALVVEPRVAPLSATARARVQELLRQHDGAYLPLSQMGRWLPRATIAVEDRRFYSHGAVDLLASARAGLFDLRGGRPLQGGGTIDVQLAERLLPAGDGDPLTQALEVVVLANNLDQTYGKAGVLTLYLNDIYYGSHAYGAAAASRTFFGVPPAALTPDQAAFLAGLPNLPAVFGDHPTSPAARARWIVVLHAMVHAGQLDPTMAARLIQSGPPPLAHTA